MQKQFGLENTVFAEHNQTDETLLNLFISIRCSTCFGRVFLPSSGTQNCTYSVRYLSDRYCHLLLAFQGWQQMAVTVWQMPDAVCAVLSSWWWKENPSETCRAIISVINQLDTQGFCFTVTLFHASTCFEHMCSSTGGQNCITQPLVSSHL